ncbi:MAG: PAS domain-containing protein [Cyanobacteriota bacterium]
MLINKNFIESIIDHLPVGFFYTDIIGNCLYVNKKWCSISEISKQDSLGFGWLQIVHSEDINYLNNSCNTMMEEKSQENIIYRIITPSDKIKTLNVQAKYIFDEESNSEFFIGFVNDITQNVKIERTIKENSDRFELVARVGNNGIWDWDLENNSIFLSKRFKEILGYEEYEIDNNFDVWEKLVHPEDQKNKLDSLEKFKLGEILDYNQDQRYLHKNGDIIYLNCKAISIKDKNNKIIRLIGVCSDITEEINFQKTIIKAKHDAEIASKAKSDFLSVMSHEIRTPLNAIVGMVNLMIQEEHSELQNDNLNTLKFSSENLLSILNDILDFTKIEEGQINFEYVEFDIVKLAENIKKSHIILAEENNNNINLNIDSNIDSLVIGDPSRLSQIINNLVSNASKFTKNGFININISIENTKENFLDLLFVISDTGIGIEKDKIDFIFEKFTQANSDNTRKYGGTGLGLSIVKKLLELQHSKINVQSEFGKGTKFHFTLRFKISNKKIKDKNTGKLPQLNENEKKLDILLVEDNKINIIVAKKFLQKWGFIVDVAENGLISLEKLTQKKFDLILMDLQMPEMDGYTATEIIRRDDKKIPILALTASSTLEDMERAKKTGFNDFIVKPFNPDDLYNKIIDYTENNNN